MKNWDEIIPLITKDNERKKELKKNIDNLKTADMSWEVINKKIGWCAELNLMRSKHLLIHEYFKMLESRPESFKSWVEMKKKYAREEIKEIDAYLKEFYSRGEDGIYTDAEMLRAEMNLADLPRQNQIIRILTFLEQK